MEDTSHVLRWFRGKQFDILVAGVRDNGVDEEVRGLRSHGGGLSTHSRIIGPSAAGPAATLQLAEFNMGR